MFEFTGTSVGGNGSEKLLTNFICVKVPPKRCLSTSGESFNRFDFDTGDKRTPNDKLVVRNNKLEHFTQKRKIDVDMLRLLKKGKWQ